MKGIHTLQWSDVDLHYRLKKLDLSIRFLKEASVIHPWRVQPEPFKIGNKRFFVLTLFHQKIS